MKAIKRAEGRGLMGNGNVTRISTLIKQYLKYEIGFSVTKRVGSGPFQMKIIANGSEFRRASF